MATLQEISDALKLVENAGKLIARLERGDDPHKDLRLELATLKLNRLRNNVAILNGFAQGQVDLSKDNYLSNALSAARALDETEIWCKIADAYDPEFKLTYRLALARLKHEQRPTETRLRELAELARSRGEHELAAKITALLSP